MESGRRSVRANSRIPENARELTQVEARRWIAHHERPVIEAELHERARGARWMPPKTCAIIERQRPTRVRKSDGIRFPDGRGASAEGLAAVAAGGTRGSRALALAD